MESPDVESPSPEVPVLISKESSKTYRSTARLCMPKGLKSVSVWRRFLPAILVYPVWVYVMTKLNLWEEAFSSFWIMSFTMIFGSLVAGSTPVGGGAVAFPVMVLFIKMLPEQGRDFSLMIQASGMSAATFQLLYAQRKILNFWLILWFVISVVPGLILGFEIPMNSRVTSLSFTTAMSCFVLAFGYYREFRCTDKHETDAQKNAAVEAFELLQGPFDLDKSVGYRLCGTQLPLVLTALACFFGLAGGFLTAKIGSGADMMAYIFGILWNSLVPPEAEMSENMLTASSVVIMAVCSVFGTAIRLTTTGISQEVLLCWSCCGPVVVVGAPLGSMLLTPSCTKFLRRAFYVFVLVQFISMATLQLKDDWVAWTGVLVTLLVVVAAIVISHLLR